MKRQLYQGRNVAYAASIADLAAMAKKRLPNFAWEYLEGGAEDELAMQRNRRSFDDFTLTPRTLVDVSQRDQSVSLWDQSLSSPMLIGPTGFNGMLWPDADRLLSSAAAQFGIPFCLATLSNSRLESVAQAMQRYPNPNLWLQLYLFKDRSCTTDLLNRAKHAGVSTIVLTTDATVYGNRNWEARNYRGFKQPNWRNRLQLIARPHWVWQILINGLPRFSNLDEFIGKQADALQVAAWIESQMDTRINWHTLSWLRDQWQGKLLIKGVLHPDDAKQAASIGVDGIVVSNHGGRQLDVAPAAFECLPAITEAIQGRCKILLDSGIRRGTDILKAKANGADAVMLGRATLYGVAADGANGVTRALTILHTEIDNAMAQLGMTNLHHNGRREVDLISRMDNPE
ncbi:alpha-hydroxy-acid oxidizing protein [Leeia sp. TBRC 13508]|uniref:Alpha-hydroxy-acid oxidizing protein n=1 Tax=Leeia speluncae TaxID=2884804 RepID=A0ABS8D7C4_9NEIS|nr:alpha-hydroxy acid oxidase [Leeia speluncae]MCB6184047.1 alpha-hydroxy-acid oxidizing protein [Leeia speluncae]